jgi:hypothetical protein
MVTSRPRSVRSSPWVCVVALGSYVGTVERVNVGDTPIPPVVRDDDIGVKMHDYYRHVKLLTA